MARSAASQSAFDKYLAALFPFKAGGYMGKTKHGRKGVHGRGRGHHARQHHSRGHLDAAARVDPWRHKGQAAGQG